MIPGGLHCGSWRSYCSSCGGGHHSSLVQLNVTRKMNQSWEAFSSGLGRVVYPGFVLYNKSCVYFEGSLMLGSIQYQPLSIQCSFCILLIKFQWNESFIKNHTDKVALLPVNKSVCSFNAFSPTTLLSFTIVQNIQLASQPTVYSQKTGWASWSLLADCIWCWHLCPSFHHCCLY